MFWKLLSDEERSYIEKCLSEFNNTKLKIVEYVADGLTDKEISERIYLSVAGVKYHISNILKDTGLKNRVMLALVYREINRQ